MQHFPFSEILSVSTRLEPMSRFFLNSKAETNEYMLLISCEDVNKESNIAYVKLFMFKFGQKFGQSDSIFDGSKNIDSSTGAIVGICLLLKSRFFQ